jgi:hypothetical protein
MITTVLRPALIALLAGAGAAAHASPVTTANLVRNGDAEWHACTGDWTAQTPVPGWRVLRGAASVLCYSAFTLAAEAPELPDAGQAGKALLSAPGADTAIEQDVDVAAAGAAIDAGGVQFALAAWLGGWRDQPERALVTAVFLDARRHATGDPVVLADGAAPRRTGLRACRLDGAVPPGTRRIVLTVQFPGAMNSYANAYADNIRLTLRGEVSDLHPAGTVAPPAAIPPLDHVLVAMMENTNYADVVRTRAGAIDPHMPFLASLARQGVILGNLWANYHPSDQNYVAMVAGDTFRYGPSYYPYHLAERHLGDLLEAAGKDWRAYVQHMKTPCNLVADAADSGYAPDDEPFAQFADVTDAPARCRARLRDLADFHADIAARRLPAFAWLAADGWSSGEGAWHRDFDVGFANAEQDAFLRMAFSPLLDSPLWKQSRSLLVITWDESGGWGWPDNHVPTIVVGSPGLLAGGRVVDVHYDGYSVLRTVEAALGLPGLGRQDRYAEPLNAVFAPPSTDPVELWTDSAAATRGSMADTFGQPTTPAAVVQGERLQLLASGDPDSDLRVALAPLGRTPDATSPSFAMEPGDRGARIPTAALAPGVYGAWLRHGLEPPHSAPLLLRILPPSRVRADQPGVEILGAPELPSFALREGGNLLLRYCRPADVPAGATWIGVFAADAPASQWTRIATDAKGYWLRTPGNPAGAACGETLAYAAELSPDTEYRVLLLRDAPDRPPTPVGRAAAFHLVPALPR